jgi:hypothetical protein
MITVRCHTTNEKSSGVDEDLKDVFILDTGSTIGATLMNPKLMSNIQMTTTPLEMITNAGTRKTLVTLKRPLLGVLTILLLLGRLTKNTEHVVDEDFVATLGHRKVCPSH